MQWVRSSQETSELVPLENFFEEKTVLKDREEKTKVLNRKYRQFWISFPGAIIRASGATTLSRSR